MESPERQLQHNTSGVGELYAELLRNKTPTSTVPDNDDDDAGDVVYNPQNIGCSRCRCTFRLRCSIPGLYASYMLNTRKHDATVNSTTLSGTTRCVTKPELVVTAGHSTQDGDSGGVNAPATKGTYANLSAGYNH
ncbi:hypothetical protein KCP69_24200 [Salmonella enterica subsp. enterica]|nr:hypothetical protein KCP69_24200 [Salmonella enterica subsp. enterica]